jgi:hypothetical protein
MLYTMEGINSSTPQNNVKETETEAGPRPVQVEEDAQLTSYPLLDLVLRRLTNVLSCIARSCNQHPPSAPNQPSWRLGASRVEGQWLARGLVM